MIRIGSNCGDYCAVVLVFLLPLAGGAGDVFWGRSVRECGVFWWCSFCLVAPGSGSRRVCHNETVASERMNGRENG